MKAQTKGAIIDKLNFELFTEDTAQIYLHDLVICENHKIDSTIRIRKHQPNPDAVITILGKAMMENDDASFDLIYASYKKHISNFNKEWGQVYLDNFYCCGIIQKQFNVLKAFEIVLRSLKFKKDNTTTEDIFNFYIKEIQLGCELLEQPSRIEIIKEFKVFSEEYRKLNSIAWFGGSVPYHYLDPYMKELKSFFIDYIQQCHWNESFPQECMIAWSSMHFYFKIDDSKLAEYFLNNFINWKSMNRQSLIYTYAGIQYHPKLAKMLIIDLISSKEKIKTNAQVRKHYFRLLFSAENKLILKEVLMTDVVKKWNPFAVRLLSYFPEKDVIQLLNKLKRKNRLIEENINIIDQTISNINSLDTPF